MIEAIVIACLLGFIGWQDYNNRKERKDLINALKAKDANELANLQLADQTKIEVAQPEADELTPIPELSDEEFDKHVLNKDA